jgi:hypothetical protein
VRRGQVAGAWRVGALLCALALLSGAREGAAQSAPTQPGATALPGAIAPEDALRTHPTFDTYWYQGLAEVNRYGLTQSRYGELHDGEAVLIYVTEEFDAEAQVKWDHGERTHVVPILKLNAYRRFYTGVYPYTIMTSVFAPVAPGALALKVTMAVQEWCGTTFSQLNLRDGGYQGLLFSYFQSEGDQRFDLPEGWLEDALWTQLRRDPEGLPTGSFALVPSLVSLRLNHREAAALPASATLSDPQPIEGVEGWDQPVRHYAVRYDASAGTGRSLDIWFEAAFPHRVVAWEETGPALYNPAGGAPEVLTTRAVLTNSVLLDYWARHGADDGAYRALLGLSE